MKPKDERQRQSNLVVGGALDKAFVVFHRMIMTMAEAEPTVKVVLVAYDEEDKETAEAILISNMSKPADVEALLKDGLNSAQMKRVLKNTIRN